MRRRIRAISQKLSKVYFDLKVNPFHVAVNLILSLVVEFGGELSKILLKKLKKHQTYEYNRP